MCAGRRFRHRRYTNNGNLFGRHRRSAAGSARSLGSDRICHWRFGVHAEGRFPCRGTGLSVGWLFTAVGKSVDRRAGWVSCVRGRWSGRSRWEGGAVDRLDSGMQESRSERALEGTEALVILSLLGRRRRALGHPSRRRSGGTGGWERPELGVTKERPAAGAWGTYVVQTKSRFPKEPALVGVETRGLEPLTPALQRQCSAS
jgi:hypothetical protein